MSKPQKPGEIPARPGEYTEREAGGGQVPKPRRATMDPGDKPLPPTQKPNRTWVHTSRPNPNKGKK